MPQITLALTDTEARAIAALEAIDGRTVDQRFAPYVRDVVQNAAGIDLSKSPERIEARLTELEQDAAMAIAAREQASTTTAEPTLEEA
jgi:hypothetical protein